MASNIEMGMRSSIVRGFLKWLSWLSPKKHDFCKWSTCGILIHMTEEEIKLLTTLQTHLDNGLTIKEISALMCMKQYHVSVLKKKLEKYNQIKRFL